jgi:ABC-type uncharacterized transport system involved in gliding motility auxiliary subunit
MKKKQLETLLYSTVGVAVMFFTLIAANVILASVRQRVDLTADRLFTLSPGTRAILDKLDTPVKVRFYCTRGENAMPLALKNYAERVEDLLMEYRQYSRGKIQVEKLDPQPDSDAEESAAIDGVEGQPISVTDKIYLGLAVSCLDAKETIPFLSPEREKLLEYDLSRAIARVASPTKPVLGIMSALPIFGTPMNPMMMRMGNRGQEPWVVVSELKRDFTVKQVEMSADRIEDDIKVLIVIHPRDISETAQYAIDQFLMRGGKLLAFLDPNSIADQGSDPTNPLQRAASSGSNMEKLLKAWGVEYDPNKVMADMNYVTRLNRSGRVENVPTVLSLTPDAINRDDVLTSQLDNVLVAYPGGFSGTPAAGLTQTVLLKTSTDSQLVEKMLAEFSAEQIIKDFKPSGKEYALAVRLTGKFKTAFPEGKPGAPKEDPDKETKPPELPAGNSLKESETETSVVLVADSDLIYDPVCAQIQNLFGQRIVMLPNGNLNFAQSIVEQLSGDSNLIGVRSRATLNRPFTVVRGMQAKAEENYRSKIKELESSLQETQTRLNELQKSKETGQRFILSPEQQAEVANFRKKEADAKKQLKEVRRNLRRDIDALENRLKWLNIAGMPFLVTISGVALAVYKKKRTAAK